MCCDLSNYKNRQIMLRKRQMMQPTENERENKHLSKIETNRSVIIVSDIGNRAIHLSFSCLDLRKRSYRLLTEKHRKIHMK